jgi:HK97 family phage major capsid protein
MAFNRDSNNIVLRPDEFGEIYYRPLRGASVALQVTRNVQTGASTYRVPVVTAFPTAEWTAEGAVITATDPTVTEVSCTPPKLAGLTVVSREMLDDSGGDAASVITNGLINDLARKIDEAFFGAPVSALAPNGLRDLTTEQVVNVTGDFANLDAFAEALSKAETVGAQVNSFVAAPATVLALQQLKESTGSNRPLLGADVSSPTGRSILGVPVYSSPHVEADVVWAIPAPAAVSVLRTPAELSVSDDAYFSSYSVGVRVVQRAGFVFPHEAAIVKITANAAA